MLCEISLPSRFVSGRLKESSLFRAVGRGAAFSPRRTIGFGIVRARGLMRDVTDVGDGPYVPVVSPKDTQRSRNSSVPLLPVPKFGRD